MVPDVRVLVETAAAAGGMDPPNRDGSARARHYSAPGISVGISSFFEQRGSYNNIF
jgi:hypothetical protein